MSSLFWMYLTLVGWWWGGCVYYFSNANSNCSLPWKNMVKWTFSTMLPQFACSKLHWHHEGSNRCLPRYFSQWYYIHWIIVFSIELMRLIQANFSFTYKLIYFHRSFESERGVDHWSRFNEIANIFLRNFSWPTRYGIAWQGHPFFLYRGRHAPNSYPILGSVRQQLNWFFLISLSAAFCRWKCKKNLRRIYSESSGVPLTLNRVTGTPLLSEYSRRLAFSSSFLMLWIRMILEFI